MVGAKKRQLENQLDDTLRRLHAYKYERDHRVTPSKPLNLMIVRYEMLADELTDELCEVDNG